MDFARSFVFPSPGWAALLTSALPPAVVQVFFRGQREPLETREFTGSSHGKPAKRSTCIRFNCGPSPWYDRGLRSEKGRRKGVREVGFRDFKEDF